MKKILLFVGLLFASMFVAGSVLADDSAESCTSIQSGELFNLNGVPIDGVGYDEQGYNYQAHLFNGEYCEAESCSPSQEINLIMKWNDAFTANTDCDGDKILDRHYGYDSHIGSGAWLTNHQSGEYEGEDGELCQWNYFVKVVAASSDSVLENDVWYSADGQEIGPSVWGAFAIVQEVENNPCNGVHGQQYLSDFAPGLGLY